MKPIESRDYDTLSQAVNALTEAGFSEDFRAFETGIIGTDSGKEYLPEDLRILHHFRFEGMTDPQDDAVLFAIVATDGTKGTLVMSYGAKQDQDAELIKRIPWTEH